MKHSIDGTSDATGGLREPTSWSPSFKVRLAGFALAVTAIAVLIGWIDTSIWRGQARLQEEFAAIRAEKFYFGVNFRVSLRQIRDGLLDLPFPESATDRKALQREAFELRDWLQSKEKIFGYKARKRFL
jgi:hypothetical protein